MSPQDRTISLRFDAEVLAVLEDNRQRFGVPVSEQIRRAVADWLERGGVLAGVAGVQRPRPPASKPPTTRPRTSTRKRS
ncbi:MAG: hypothetical protein IT182_03840 [Acidobacteria bacterium]|nr:hypothetical protein [Acidobacteriota bacterium]